MKNLLRFKYRPFHQFPFCCVPTTLQWILYRRGLDILDPITIGAELGLRIPEKFAKYIDEDTIKAGKVKIMPTETDSQNFGTQIFQPGYSINGFFQKFNIPLKMSEQFFFDNEKDLENFFLENLTDDKDIIIRFHTGIFLPNSPKYGGHFSVIADYDQPTKTVIIGDPEPPNFKETTLPQILYSISDQPDGIQRGFFVVKST